MSGENDEENTGTVTSMNDGTSDQENFEIPNFRNVPKTDEEEQESTVYRPQPLCRKSKFIPNKTNNGKFEIYNWKF